MARVAELIVVNMHDPDLHLQDWHMRWNRIATWNCCCHRRGRRWKTSTIPRHGGSSDNRRKLTVWYVLLFIYGHLLLMSLFCDATDNQCGVQRCQVEHKVLFHFLNNFYHTLTFSRSSLGKWCPEQPSWIPGWLANLLLQGSCICICIYICVCICICIFYLYLHLYLYLYLFFICIFICVCICICICICICRWG